MPPKVKLAETLHDDEYVELEWTKHGNRKKLSESKNPLTSAGSKKAKGPATPKVVTLPRTTLSKAGPRNHPPKDNAGPHQQPTSWSETDQNDFDGACEGHWDEDVDVNFGEEYYRQPLPDPPQSTSAFNPELLERDRNAKTSYGKSTHDYMGEWRDTRLSDYFFAMLEREGRGSSCEDCPFGKAEYRCLDCMGCPRFCIDCCRQRHRHDPLHRVECWAEDAWQPAWLWQVGTIICLGHGLHACPTHGRSREAFEQEVIALTAADLPETRAYDDDPTFGAKPRPKSIGKGLIVAIVHTNGFHHLPLIYCECANAPSKDIQLLRAGLYPITSADTQTVFTFQVLKHFHLMKVDSHIAVEQYCDILRRLTDDIFPDKTMDRRRELTRAWQQFNYITLLKRNGFGLTGPLQNPGKGELALFCPVCPQDGVNLPDNWRTLNDLWRFWRYLTADGNFVLDHLEVTAPDFAVWLTNGTQYMVERHGFGQFIRGLTEGEDPGDCNKLRAVAEKNKGKRGYDATGIVAIACARHGCFCPGSVADMQKGERQGNADYVLCQSIETTRAILLLGLRFAYDINCQYCVHFRRRIRQNEALSCPEELVIAFLIGMFHVHGHVDECLARFAPTYLPGAGVTAAEILESLWAKLNGAAGSTRNMTLAHRSETLDACMADSNWQKFRKMVAWLIAQLSRAVKECQEASADFQELNGSISVEQRDEWTKLMGEANNERFQDPKAMDAYNSSLPQVESKKDVQVKLMRAEREDEDAQMGVADWVASGMSIQDEQLELQALIRAGPKAKRGASALDLERKREAIVKHINVFLQAGAELWPEVSFHDLLVRGVPGREPCVCEEPEECICIRLSADFASHEKQASIKNPDNIVPLPSTTDNLPPEWITAAKTEEALRVAQCHEALEAIRKHIAHKSQLYRAKQSLSSGQRHNRKSYDYIGKVESNLRLEVKRYDLARGSLMRLNALQQYPELKEIERAHLKAIVSVYEPNARQQSRVALSWIWKVAAGDAEVDDAYVRDLYRTNWIRARSRLDRWTEERIMVTSEMEWFVRFAKHRKGKADSWASAAATDGHRSYALRQSRMWLRVGTFAKSRFLKESNVLVDVELEGRALARAKDDAPVGVKMEA